MRIFAIKRFSKWAQKNGLSDTALRDAVAEIERGLVDADLGGNIYKKRIATKGRGKSASVRTIVAYSKGNRTFFLYAFEKSQRANIKDNEKEQLKILGGYYLNCSDAELEEMIASGEMIEYKEHNNG
jgi:hypothetical protein